MRPKVICKVKGWGDTMLQDTWKYIYSPLPCSISLCSWTNSKNQTSKQASYHRVTADASSSGMNLHFLNTLRDRLSVSQLLQGQARVCQPISLSPMDKGRSDPYFLNNSQHFLVVIFFPKHTLLLSFLGLCLPPALAIFICTSPPSNALVCSSLLSC